MKEYRRETGAEIHDTVIKIRDDASLASACKMLERYEQEREEAKARRREMRRKKRES